MRLVVTGGAGFIGRSVVARLVDRGDEVVALVRDPYRAAHLVHDAVTLVRSSLDDPAALRHAMSGADGVIHAAGSYRVGIRADERPAMWDANVGATERVLDAATDAGVARMVYVSTLGVLGNTRGAVVDEGHRRDPRDPFLSWYDETKYRGHEAAEARIAAGAPIVIAMPGQTYGPHDHSLASHQLELAHDGRLRYLVLEDVGLAWVHVHDLAAGIVAAFDGGRPGEAYGLGGEIRTIGEAIEIAARVGGRHPPRLRVPTVMLRAVAPLNDRVGGLPGFPANLREALSAGVGVTHWATHAKATTELGFEPRALEQGVADTWGRR
jgi:dihydroflavonol-4-reductase